MGQKLRKDRVDTQTHQIDQMREKQEARERELEQKRSIAQQIESDVIEFEREQQGRHHAARQRNLQFRMELEKQIQAKEALQVAKKDGMNDIELRINRRLLENAQQILGTSEGVAR